MNGSWRHWYGYFIAVLAEALLVYVLLLINPIVPMGRYPMVYIVMVMLSAYFLGEGPAIISLVLGWAAFTHFFLPPERFWPLAGTPEGWAAQASYILGTFIVGFAATVVRRSERRIQQLVSEAERRSEALQRALDVESYLSRQLQRALLPPKPEIGEGYHVAHKYIPAYADREIGGDFYDVFRAEDGKIAIVIGDVSGKGLEAASMAAITRATVHAFAYEFSQAGKALTHANRVISAQQETGQISFFVTVFVTILDPSTGEATYSSAGHPPPAIWHADIGEVGFLELGNPPVGVIARYEFGEGTYRLDPGDRIVFYTDGLSEARRGAELFETDGIGRVLREHGSKPPDEVIGELASAATAWGNGHLSDDTAIVVIERE